MSNENKPPPQRKIWDINDMPVERDGIRIFEHVYDFAGPADISAQDMAEIMRLETRIRQQQAEQQTSEAGEASDDEQQRQVEEMFALAKFRTRLILASAIADDALDKLSLRHHEFICTSFWQASNAAGKQPQEATSGAATSGAVTSSTAATPPPPPSASKT